MDIDVAPRDMEILLSLLDGYLPGTTVPAHGSRVAGNSTPRSDLDLVVFPCAGNGRRLSELREAFEESSLPFRVDILEWDSVGDDVRAGIESAPVSVLTGGDWKRK